MKSKFKRVGPLGIEYTFNARRELIASDRRVGNGCGVRTSYRYDLNHNRIGQNSFRYQHNAADQLLDYPGPGSAASLSYNSQGQANQVGNLALTYNQSQQIKTAQNGAMNAHYEYDSGGRRMAKEVNGDREEYLMLGQEVLKTFDGSGNVKADYFLGLGRQGIKTDGSWKYYLSDGLGSTALLTDGSGNTVAAYDYEDYGATTQIAGSADVYNPYRYTGQEWDAELGMYNLRARHYSPSLGRFLARDPIGYAGGTNLMAYCQGDPVDFVDPTGHKLQILGDVKGLQGLLQEETGASVCISDTGVVKSVKGGSGLVADLLRTMARLDTPLVKINSTTHLTVIGIWGNRLDAKDYHLEKEVSSHRINVGDFGKLGVAGVPRQIITALLGHELMEAYVGQTQHVIYNVAHAAAINFENKILAGFTKRIGNPDKLTYSLGTIEANSYPEGNVFQWLPK